MPLVDVSMPLGSGTPSYPGDTPFSRNEQRSLGDGDDLTLSKLSMSAHGGTHVDAPSHFLPQGATVSDLAVDAFSGPALLLDLRGVSHAVGKHHLHPHPIGSGDILLMKTRNSQRWKRGRFFEDYIYLSDEGAQYLEAKKVKAVGIDSLSIEGFRVEGFPVHHRLLNHGIGIIEGLDLSSATPGRFWFDCFPLRVVGGDGAPARAVLWEEAPAKAI
ncbi:MAG: cyclase family protein [Thermoplasmata archaeon]